MTTVEESFQARDEGRHTPDGSGPWCETWDFDFCSPDGDLAGWSALTLWPTDGVAWYHGYLVGAEPGLIAVVEHQVPLPTSGLEIRTHGLWAAHICETPFDHWTIGLEAFGLGLDDPAEMYGRQFGEQVALGFDLEWEAETEPEADGAADGYWQGCRVSGDILVGDLAIDFDGYGARHHDWGPPVFPGTVRVTVRLSDGERVAAHTGPGARRADEPALAADGPTGGRLQVPGGSVTVDPVAVAPLAIPGQGSGQRRTPRALCHARHSDGRTGWGWMTFT